MDRFLTFCGAMAWPIATMVIVLVFRRDVGQAMGRLGQFKYRDLEVTFREDLRQAEKLALSIPTSTFRGAVVQEVAPDEAKPLGGQLIVVPSSEEPLERANPPVPLADRPPRDAIEGAWLLVVRSLVRASKLPGDRRSAGTSDPDLAARVLVDRGALTDPEVVLIRLLRTLRDRSSRLDLPPPSADDARRFVDLADKIVTRVDKID